MWRSRPVGHRSQSATRGRRRTNLGTQSKAGRTCAAKMPSADAYTTPTAPKRSATAHPRPIVIAAMQSVHNAFQRASFGLVSKTFAGRPTACTSSNAPNASASAADTSICPPDSTVAAHGPISTMHTAAVTAVPANAAVPRHHIRIVSSAAARLLTNTGQYPSPAVHKTDQQMAKIWAINAYFDSSAGVDKCASRTRPVCNSNGAPIPTRNSHKLPASIPGRLLDGGTRANADQPSPDNRKPSTVPSIRPTSKPPNEDTAYQIPLASHT